MFRTLSPFTCIAVTLVVLLTLTLGIGCGGAAPDLVRPAAPEITTVRIAAAADLRFALPELLAEFERDNPAVRCVATFGASGTLFAQLQNGAPQDLFLSADLEYPERLIELDLADRESLFRYAVGHLVVWVPNGSDLDLEHLGLGALRAPSVRKIAIANPQHAPYGRAARAALDSAGLLDEVNERLVLAENVAQAGQFVESGAAEIGLISRSLALAPRMRERGRFWVVPEDAYPPLIQWGVILKGTPHGEAARRVRAFLRSERGQARFAQFGFGTPES